MGHGSRMKKIVKFLQIFAAIKKILANGRLTIIGTFIGTFLLGILEGYGATLSLLGALLFLAAIIIIIHWGLDLYERFFPFNKSIPLLNVFKQAQKYGWNFSVDGGLQIPYFVNALQQAGLDGTLVFRGRFNNLRPLHNAVFRKY